MNVVYDPKKEMSFKTELFDEWLNVGAKQYTISARKVFFFFNKGDYFEEVNHNCYVTHAQEIICVVKNWIFQRQGNVASHFKTLLPLNLERPLWFFISLWCN